MLLSFPVGIYVGVHTTHIRWPCFLFIGCGVEVFDSIYDLFISFITFICVITVENIREVITRDVEGLHTFTSSLDVRARVKEVVLDILDICSIECFIRITNHIKTVFVTKTWRGSNRKCASSVSCHKQ